MKTTIKKSFKRKDTASPTIRGIMPRRTRILKICGKI
ncbi:hypothetical protein N406_00505 [Helicobacter pylori FD577]|nr:hypothetical protein N406_00505 [Helicobacter pylori FD577]